jgi:hypothetical protein
MMHENPKLAVFTFEQTTEENGWKEKAVELLATHEFSEDFRQTFHDYWTVAGHHIRAQISNDAELVSLLRAILPPYLGPDRTLYRGENHDRWKSRQIGLCWSEKINVARMFGSGLNAIRGGGVLLRCNVSRKAIISGSSKHSLYLGEHEYTVDPFKSTSVEVIEEYSSSN